MIIFNISCEKHLQQLIKIMLPQLIKYKYHIFLGDLGAGKTTIIKAILSLLGTPIEIVTSPTFNYIKIIECIIGKAAHIDLYRISNIEQAIEIVESEIANIYLIEWGDILLKTEKFYYSNTQLATWRIITNFNNKTVDINKNFL